MIELRCNDCGHIAELPEDYFDVPRVFWDRHGHRPCSVSILCSCGAEHQSGPANAPERLTHENVERVSRACWQRDIAFYIAHRLHN